MREPRDTTQGKPKRQAREISIRASTYEKLQALARKNGEHISTTVDAIITRYLDGAR